ncbi:hypothetical protein [Nioella sp.]|uniref:hypothetical protein n=1 Tax=Nioella sp. TaxID=1912091 RepID=UPI0035169888
MILQIVLNPETGFEKAQKGGMNKRTRAMLKRRWMERVLEESQKEQIEMPWARGKRNRRRMAGRSALTA